MESFTPKVGDKVCFYGDINLAATLIKTDVGLGLFILDDGRKWCYGIELPIKFKYYV